MVEKEWTRLVTGGPMRGATQRNKPGFNAGVRVVREPDNSTWLTRW